MQPSVHMSSAIGKSIKPLLLVAIVLNGSCSNSPENKPTDIPAYVAKWHPRENDGVSLDHISELWQDMKSMEGVSMVPAYEAHAPGSFAILKKAGDSHVLVDPQGNEYLLPADIASRLLKWRTSPLSETRAWIVISTSKETNERRVLAVAEDGGPFYKMGAPR